MCRGEVKIRNEIEINKSMMVVDFVSRFEAEDGEVPFLLILDDVTEVLDADVTDVSTSRDTSELPLDLSSSK